MSSVNSSPAVIPRPLMIKRKAGAFALTSDTWIVADADNRWNASYLRNLLTPPTGLLLPIHGMEETRNDRGIQLRIGGRQEILGHEGYALTVTPTSIVIEAPAAVGVHYGIQTLRQLLPELVETRAPVPDIVWQIPAVEIIDRPRFKWRGLMLDEARHFHGKETLLRTLDLMALQKLNVLHWHLTDDQGWRIEIKRYPRLTEVGSRREGTARGLFGKLDGVPHSGFYTQEEIREIVVYASERHITIVPEIEMPGHAMAALAAYPELSCTGGPFKVTGRFGPKLDIMCAGKESVFTFVEEVLDEVMALFPGTFIHIGGDEVLKRRWKKCPDCQARIRREGLKDVHKLQVYFTNRVAAYLDAPGRRAVGWNEILQEGLVESAVAQYWIGHHEAVIESIHQGRDVIMSSFLRTYLDHSYSLTPLSKAYAYEPVFPELNEQDAMHVLGLEACLWTEMVPNRDRMDYQTYPRLTALAEVGWTSQARKDFEDFQRRLVPFLRRLDHLGVRYAPLSEVEPSWYRRWFGLLSITQPQTKTAPT